jgi:hypothetical protein
MQVGDQTKQDASVQGPEPFIGSTSRTNTTANGTQSITGVGFRPTWVMCSGTAGGGGDTDSASFGFATSTTGRAQFHNHSGNATQKNVDDDSLIRYVDSATILNEGNLTSMDADGFTITWTKTGAPTGNTLLRFICFK